MVTICTVSQLSWWMALILEVLLIQGGGTLRPGMLSSRDEIANIKILIAIFNAAEMFQPLRTHAFSLHILRGGGLTPYSYMFLWCHVPRVLTFYFQTAFNTHNWRDGVFDFVLGVSVQFSLCDTVMIIFIVMGNVLMLLLLERYVVIDNWNSQRLTFQVPPRDLQSFNHHLPGYLRLNLIWTLICVIGKIASYLL